MENMPKIICPNCHKPLSFKVKFENIHGKTKLTSRENIISIGLSGLVMQDSKVTSDGLFCLRCKTDVDVSDIILYNGRTPVNECTMNNYIVIKVTKGDARAQYLLYNKYDEKFDRLLADYKRHDYSVEQLPLLLKVQE